MSFRPNCDSMDLVCLHATLNLGHKPRRTVSAPYISGGCLRQPCCRYPRTRRCADVYADSQRGGGLIATSQRICVAVTALGGQDGITAAYEGLRQAPPPHRFPLRCWPWAYLPDRVAAIYVGSVTWAWSYQMCSISSMFARLGWARTRTSVPG